jgi:hypothetical protein
MSCAFVVQTDSNLEQLSNAAARVVRSNAEVKRKLEPNDDISQAVAFLIAFRRQMSEHYTHKPRDQVDDSVRLYASNKMILE